MKRKAKVIRRYPEGAEPKGEEAVPVNDASDESWRPGRKGQGGEGLSDGYGGSAEGGCGPSGPQTDRDRQKKPRPE